MNILSLFIVACSVSVIKCQFIQLATPADSSSFTCSYDIEMAYLLEAWGDLTVRERGIIGQSIYNVISSLSFDFLIKSSVTVFSDKPILPFGSPETIDNFLPDTCGVNIKTFDEILSANLVSRIEAELQRSGEDFRSNQLGVLYDILAPNGGYGWSQLNGNSQDDLPIIKLIVMYTRSSYHIAGDGLPNLIPVSTDENPSICDINDYPLVEDVTNRMNDMSIYPYFDLDHRPGGVNYKIAYDDIIANLVKGGYAVVRSEIDQNWANNIYHNIIGILEYICSNSLVVDVVFVIDLSFSYKDDLQRYKTMVKESIKEMNKKYVALRVGLASFIDKPTLGLGDRLSGDYCYRLHLPLTYDIDEFNTQLDMLQSSSGLDWKEAQLVALRSVAIDTNVGWRPELTWNGFELKRIVILATDSGYHVSEDLGNVAAEFVRSTNSFVWDNYANGPLEGDLANTPQYQNIAPIDLEPNNAIGDCNHSEYPTFTDVERYMMDRRLYLSIMTHIDLFKTYRELLNSIPNIPSSIGDLAKDEEILKSVNEAFANFNYLS